MKDEHMKCKLIEFETKGNREGKLIAIEEKTDIPFEIKRVFYILIQIAILYVDSMLTEKVNLF